MARVTVEDCIQIVQNRFELVALASQRARDIASGAALTVDRDNDKNPVIALREIAGKTISADALRDTLVYNAQRRVKSDRYEQEPVAEENMDSMDILEEIESLGVKEDINMDDGLSFEDDNLDVED